MVKVTSRLVAGLLLVAEVALVAVIVLRVGYTEIDWRAYMQEVEGFLSGERDYVNLRGDTGPCVYPAGFLYIFSALYYATEQGASIFTAQCIFGVLYLVNLGLVFALYAGSAPFPAASSVVAALRRLPVELLTSSRVGALPLWAYAVLVLSKRIHSIFVLRMFNDTVAVALGYAAFLLFIKNHWRLGCGVYSLAVSVKMNMLLYAPGLLLLLIVQSNFSAAETATCLAICSAVQVVVGMPFLLEHPVSYLTSAFDLKRQFLYKWTVNFKFLPEHVFLSRELSAGLLLVTVATYILYAAKWTASVDAAANHQQKRKKALVLSPRFVLTILFTSNFIGVVFARTLHYQFYSWYFHQLPFLLHQARVPGLLAVFAMAVVEACFLTYPATPLSSSALTVVHVALLVLLYTSPVDAAESSEEAEAENIGLPAGKSDGAARGKKTKAPQAAAAVESVLVVTPSSKNGNGNSTGTSSSSSRSARRANEAPQFDYTKLTMAELQEAERALTRKKPSPEK
jgi:alpha-1,3-mannosyltransferase